MKKSVFAVAVLMAPGLAFATPHGARVGIGLSTMALGMSGAGASVSAGAVPALSLSLTSTPRLGYSRARVRASISESSGAAHFEQFRIGLTPNPRGGFSPVASVGVLDESVQPAAISYQVFNPQTFLVSNVTVTPPRLGVVTGFASAGLRYQHALSSSLRVRASAAALVGFGGSTTGLPPAASQGSGMGHQIGVALVYDPASLVRVTVDYSRQSLPVRGYTLTERDLALRVSCLFF